MAETGQNPVELIKRAAMEAVQAGKPAEIRFGTVLSASPLKILVDQKLTLGERQLVLTRSVTDFEVDLTVSHQTEETAGGGGDEAFSGHRHIYKGRKKVKIHNALLEGDQVALLRLQGGRQFLVADRVKEIPKLEGEFFMIPEKSDVLRENFVIRKKEGKTFALHPESGTISGFADGREAVKQAIYLMLSVERYAYLIHSWNYGAELRALFGKPVSYCLPEIKRRVREALLQDDRIKEVRDFSFEVGRGRVHARFTADTIYGPVGAETEVRIS